jgi:hypothetical protein
MSYRTLLDIDFSRDSDTKPGAAGTMTGAGHGLVDIYGSLWHIAGGLLVAEAPGGPAYMRSALRVPGSDSEMNVRVTVRLPAGRKPLDGFALQSRTEGNINTLGAVFLSTFGADNGKDVFLGWIGDNNAFAVEAYTNFKLASALDPAHAYDIEFTTEGANPTTLRGRILKVSDNSIVFDQTVSMPQATAPDHQNVGYAGVFAPNRTPYGDTGHFPIARLKVEVEKGVTPLVTGTPFLVDQDDRAVEAASDLSAGTAPLAVSRWDIKQDDWLFTPDSGTLVAGETEWALTRGIKSDELYSIRYTGADAARQVSLSGALLVEGTVPARVSLPPLKAEFAKGVVLAVMGDSNNKSGEGIAAAKKWLEAHGVRVVPVASTAETCYNGSHLVLHWGMNSAPYLGGNGVPEGTGNLWSHYYAEVQRLAKVYPGLPVMGYCALGTNDAQANQTNYAAFKQTLRDHGKEHARRGWRFFACCPPWIHDSSQTVKNTYILQYRKIMREVAQETGSNVLLGDRRLTYQTYLHPKYYAQDGIHYGAAVQGELVAEHLRFGIMAAR